MQHCPSTRISIENIKSNMFYFSTASKSPLLGNKINDHLFNCKLNILPLIYRVSMLPSPSTPSPRSTPSTSATSPSRTPHSSTTRVTSSMPSLHNRILLIFSLTKLAGTMRGYKGSVGLLLILKRRRIRDLVYRLIGMGLGFILIGKMLIKWWNIFASTLSSSWDPNANFVLGSLSTTKETACQLAPSAHSNPNRKYAWIAEWVKDGTEQGVLKRVRQASS